MITELFARATELCRSMLLPSTWHAIMSCHRYIFLAFGSSNPCVQVSWSCGHSAYSLLPSAGVVPAFSAGMHAFTFPGSFRPAYCIYVALVSSALCVIRVELTSLSQVFNLLLAHSMYVRFMKNEKLKKIK
jgi:hypothetical protein